MTGSLTLNNDLAELSRLSQWVQELGDKVGLEPRELFHLDMSLEEVVTNVMKYAYGEGVTLAIELAWQLKEENLIVTVTDFGPEFNPLKAAAPEKGLELEQMSIGGLGIHLTIKMMDRVEYSRVDDKNILTLAKRVAP